jgi:hypothetical protein
VTGIWWGGVAMALAAAAPPESAQKFDGRGWKVGNRKESPTQILTEYVLPGQTVENWQELVTSQVFKDPRHLLRLDAFVDKIHDSMASGCPSLVWKVIRQDKTSVLLEYHDLGCGGAQPESDLLRLAIGDEGVYRLAYAARIRGPLPPERRKAWMAILSEVPLAEGGANRRQPDARASGSPAAVDARTAAALAERVRFSGQPCPAGLKSARGRSEGPMAVWALECSDGHAYTILVGPGGDTTVLRKPN